MKKLLLTPFILGLTLAANAHDSRRIDHHSCETYIMKSKIGNLGLDSILKEKNYNVIAVENATEIKPNSLYIEATHMHHKIATDMTYVAIYGTDLKADNTISYKNLLTISRKKNGRVQSILKSMIPNCNIAITNTAPNKIVTNQPINNGPAIMEPYHQDSSDEIMNENE